jgi:hypothetical protein
MEDEMHGSYGSLGFWFSTDTAKTDVTNASIIGANLQFQASGGVAKTTVKLESLPEIRAKILALLNQPPGSSAYTQATVYGALDDGGDLILSFDRPANTLKFGGQGAWSAAKATNACEAMVQHQLVAA